jgi:hypothetical protein
MDLFLRATAGCAVGTDIWPAIIENQRSNIMERQLYGTPTRAWMFSVCRAPNGVLSLQSSPFVLILVRLILRSVIPRTLGCGLLVAADRGCGVFGRSDVRFRPPEWASRNTGTPGGDFLRRNISRHQETIFCWGAGATMAVEETVPRSHTSIAFFGLQSLALRAMSLHISQWQFVQTLIHGGDSESPR